MQLPGLMGSYKDVRDWAGSSGEIDGITPGSDRALPGCLFVALPGAGEGGQGRVHQALLRGALRGLGGWPPDELPEHLPRESSPAFTCSTQ